jgi:hypothetical protein
MLWANFLKLPIPVIFGPMYSVLFRQPNAHFYVLLTAHPCIIFEIKPTLCTISSWYVYFFSLHVSDACVPIIRRNNCIYATLGTSILCG